MKLLYELINSSVDVHTISVRSRRLGRLGTNGLFCLSNDVLYPFVSFVVFMTVILSLAGETTKWMTYADLHPIGTPHDVPKRGT